jgi:hypothetical protein
MPLINAALPVKVCKKPTIASSTLKWYPNVTVFLEGTQCRARGVARTIVPGTFEGDPQDSAARVGHDELVFARLAGCVSSEGRYQLEVDGCLRTSASFNLTVLRKSRSDLV